MLSRNIDVLLRDGAWSAERGSDVRVASGFHYAGPHICRGPRRFLTPGEPIAHRVQWAAMSRHRTEIELAAPQRPMDAVGERARRTPV
ncbi:hypothetical protein GCM10022402_48770 [Salinactinospora qingdaonensis]|uniref:Uncharacterized protein n=1 Tax=Salinactinospora qingdaonensis TaxID=702744 RepID=A0ABP7GJ52_9ACTN